MMGKIKSFDELNSISVSVPLPYYIEFITKKILIFLIFLTQIFKYIFSVAIVTKQEIFLVEMTRA